MFCPLKQARLSINLQLLIFVDDLSSFLHVHHSQCQADTEFRPSKASHLYAHKEISAGNIGPSARQMQVSHSTKLGGMSAHLLAYGSCHVVSFGSLSALEVLSS